MLWEQDVFGKEVSCQGAQLTLEVVQSDDLVRQALSDWMSRNGKAVAPDSARRR